MAVDQSILEALKLDTLDLPPEPRVVRLHVEEYEDWEGDPSLLIYIVIPDDTNIEKLPRGALLDLTGAIHDRLIEIGETRFPYTRVFTETNWTKAFGADACTRI